jgi:hypothetical protein
VSKIAPKIFALMIDAVAEGRRLPVVLGPPAGGDAQNSRLTAGVHTSDGRLELNSLPLLRQARAAAAKAGGPLIVALRADVEQRRLRVWLAMPGCSAGELESGTLPAGVSQLSERALALGAKLPVNGAPPGGGREVLPVLPAGVKRLSISAFRPAGGGSQPSPWALADANTAVGSLKTALKGVRRFRLKNTCTPVSFPALAAALSPVGVPVHLGPPRTGGGGGQLPAAELEAKLNKSDARLDVNSAPLMRARRARR